MRPAPGTAERGVALVITLLIVALLSILVVEFTYSIEVESHISRNALSALQATYLARSGINILAGALVDDESPRVDPGEEDGWRDFVFDHGCSPLPALELPPRWRLCVRVTDETGKINVNLTRPRRRTVNRRPPNDTGQCREQECWLEALQRLLRLHGIEDNVLEEIADYWIADVPPSPAGQPERVFAPDFTSVEDFAGRFAPLRSRAAFRMLREFTAALPRRPSRVNLNTAPPEVLTAIIDDDEVVGNILSQREEVPFSSVREAIQGVGNPRLASLFDVRSSYFRLEASAIVNGVGKTAHALVHRVPARQRNTVEGTAWDLIFLDWQKEGGARLFASGPAAGPDDLVRGRDSGKKESAQK